MLTPGFVIGSMKFRTVNQRSINSATQTANQFDLSAVPHKVDRIDPLW